MTDPNDEAKWKDVLHGLWRFKSQKDLIHVLNALPLGEAIDFRRETSAAIQASTELEIIVRLRGGELEKLK